MDDVHLHFMPLSSATGNVTLDVKWTWVPIGGTIPATHANQVNGSFGVTIPLVPADQYVNKIASVIEAPAFPVGENYSSILFVQVTRGAAGTGDTYPTGNNAGIALIYMDAHYPVDRYGSYNVVSDT
jgi:hypothetical protein